MGRTQNANHGGSGRDAQKEDFPQVLVPRSCPREPPGHAHGRAHGPRPRSCPPPFQARSQAQILLSPQAPRAAKKACNTAEGEKPECIKTHLRNMIILPEMIGSVVGVYNGKVFNQVEIKADMVAHYLGEFSITYKPVKHGTAGIGATKSSRFVPLK